MRGMYDGKKGYAVVRDLDKNCDEIGNYHGYAYSLHTSMEGAKRKAREMSNVWGADYKAGEYIGHGIGDDGQRYIGVMDTDGWTGYYLTMA